MSAGVGFAVLGISIRTPMPKQHKLQKRLDRGGEMEEVSGAGHAVHGYCSPPEGDQDAGWGMRQQKGESLGVGRGVEGVGERRCYEMEIPACWSCWPV